MNTTTETTTASARLAIVRIVAITDTRTYEEQGDRWVPIPGSGDIRQCTRCHRDHEVHAEVELADGSSAVVGTGCAARETVHLAAAFRSGEARAKRVKALRAELAKCEAAMARLEVARAIVAAMTVPEVTVTVGRAREWSHADEYIFRCGDAMRSNGLEWGTSRHRDETRYVVEQWVKNRVEEITGPWSTYTIHRDLEDVRARLKKTAA